MIVRKAFTIAFILIVWCLSAASSFSQTPSPTPQDQTFGGAAIASADYGSTYAITNCFDKNDSTTGANTTDDQWGIGYYWTVERPVIGRVAVTADDSYAIRCPTVMSVRGKVGTAPTNLAGYASEGDLIDVWETATWTASSTQYHDLPSNATRYNAFWFYCTDKDDSFGRTAEYLINEIHFYSLTTPTPSGPSPTPSPSVTPTPSPTPSPALCNDLATAMAITDVSCDFTVETYDGYDYQQIFLIPRDVPSDNASPSSLFATQAFGKITFDAGGAAWTQISTRESAEHIFLLASSDPETHLYSGTMTITADGSEYTVSVPECYFVDDGMGGIHPPGETGNYWGFERFGEWGFGYYGYLFSTGGGAWAVTTDAEGCNLWLTPSPTPTPEGYLTPTPVPSATPSPTPAYCTQPIFVSDIEAAELGNTRSTVPYGWVFSFEGDYSQ